MLRKILLPLGIDDFRDLREGGYYFADKSLFIQDVIDDAAKVILLPRPRRFGKTLNLSMLYYYFALDQTEHYRDLFKDLAIMQAEVAHTRHQNQYPVIFFTLKDIKDASYEQAYQAIAFLMADLYAKHDYLLESQNLKPYEKEFFYQIMTRKATEVEVRNSLRELVRYLHVHHGIRPILLLDEYDSPIHTAYSKSYYHEMVSFMQGFLGSALKGNLDLHKAVITGILRVAQASIFSGLNNIIVYSILRAPYSQYFGFLEEEVRHLCEQTGVSHTMADIRQWYNGYQFGNTKVYNPWSILNYLHFNTPPQPYWVNVANNTLIKDLVTQAQSDVKAQFESLLQGQSVIQTITEEMVFPDLPQKESALWNLLLFTGYLTLVNVDLSLGYQNATLKIPNLEVQRLFETMVRDWFNTQQLSFKAYHGLLESLVQPDIAKFERLLQSYIRESGSYFDFNQHTKEQVYHAFVLGLVVGLKDQYYIQSNRESGDGRFDVCLFPKNSDAVGLLIEFKKTENLAELEATATAALEQIQDRRYDTLLHQYGVKQVLYLGIAFAAKNVKIMTNLLPV